MKKIQISKIKRMLDGEWFSPTTSPRMSRTEFRELCELGFELQEQHSFGEPVFFSIEKYARQRSAALLEKIAPLVTQTPGEKQ